MDFRAQAELWLCRSRFPCTTRQQWVPCSAWLHGASGVKVTRSGHLLADWDSSGAAPNGRLHSIASHTCCQCTHHMAAHCEQCTCSVVSDPALLIQYPMSCSRSAYSSVRWWKYASGNSCHNNTAQHFASSWHNPSLVMQASQAKTHVPSVCKADRGGAAAVYMRQGTVATTKAAAPQPC